MTAVKVEATVDFSSALVAPEGRSPEIPETADVYGWLIGSWELETYDYYPDGEVRRGGGEAHFAWVLEGRAVQDVWIMPGRAERTPGLGKAGNRYGITLRVWDAAIQAWRVTWINPVTNRRDELIGRRVENDIVQIGAHADGTPIRWSYTEIAPDSFRWLGEALEPDGKTWRLEAEFYGRRLRHTGNNSGGKDGSKTELAPSGSSGTSCSYGPVAGECRPSPIVRASSFALRVV